jgi:nickel-type superoxide dismutase maturation protease
VLGFRYLAVSGPSMEPALADGDWVLARTSGRVRVGHVVVLAHPQRPGMLIVKRVARVGPDGYWVLGDAPAASTDSRQFGAVPDVLGRVVWRVRPWGPVR